ncbi:hypothetical protein TNCV_674191 [Trichonephila clavipes]|uniref:Uncharacterized protein n=1 Tax=Trichonephila clavipes TaxID=2585209 RepID=A0A8X6WD66_TRICX|nr:hypothetical protein TNCV_674191 [Trichonephila clavipes]
MVQFERTEGGQPFLTPYLTEDVPFEVTSCYPELNDTPEEIIGTFETGQLKRIVRLENCCRMSTPYTIPSNMQKHFKHELNFTRPERDPHVPRPVAVVKPIQGPTVLQIGHASPSPSSRPSTQDGRRRWTFTPIL